MSMMFGESPYIRIIYILNLKIAKYITLYNNNSDNNNNKNNEREKNNSFLFFNNWERKKN